LSDDHSVLRERTAPLASLRMAVAWVFEPTSKVVEASVTDTEATGI
jgi:hypothetical protein